MDHPPSTLFCWRPRLHGALEQLAQCPTIISLSALLAAATLAWWCKHRLAHEVQQGDGGRPPIEAGAVEQPIVSSAADVIRDLDPTSADKHGATSLERQHHRIESSWSRCLRRHRRCGRCKFGEAFRPSPPSFAALFGCAARAVVVRGQYGRLERGHNPNTDRGKVLGEGHRRSPKVDVRCKARPLVLLTLHAPRRPTRVQRAGTWRRRDHNIDDSTPVFVHADLATPRACDRTCNDPPLKTRAAGVSKAGSATRCPPR